MNLLVHFRLACRRFRDSRGGVQVSRSRRGVDSERGYALLMVVFMVGLVIVATSAIVPSLLTQARRRNEEEMIWRGKQYDRAIKHFFKKEGRYPTSLDDLVKDTHGIYFMRNAYKDPMNKEDGSWRLIYITSTGQLIGSVRWNSLQQMANDLRPQNCSPANGGNSQNPAGLGGGFGSSSGNSGSPGFGNSGFGTSPSGGQSGSGFGGQNPSSGQNPGGGGLGGLLGNGQSGAGSGNGGGSTPAGGGGPGGTGGCPAGTNGQNPANGASGIGTSGTNGTSGANGTSGSGPSTPVTTQYGDQNLNGFQTNLNFPSGQNPSNASGGQTSASGTSLNSSDDSDVQATQLVGGNIVGVGSKINKPSLKHFEKATKYKQFEFIWNPLLEVTNAVNAGISSTGATSSTSGSTLGSPLGSSGQQGTSSNPGGPAPTPSPGSGQPSSN
jgi:type II secretory pathway pseudopilin PulG